MSLRSLWGAARWPLLAILVLAGLWAVGWFFADQWTKVDGALVQIMLLAAALGYLTAMFVEQFVEVIGHLWYGRPLLGPAAGGSRTELTARGIGVVLILWAAGFVLFALVTFFLVDISAATLATREGVSLDYPETSEVFVWHFLDVVPLAQIPKTLKWEEPGPERDVLAGLLIVGYKVVVIAPVIAAVTRLVTRGDASDPRPA
jgi:hypothetical protein